MDESSFKLLERTPFLRLQPLVGGWPTPLKNMSLSVRILIPKIWKIIQMFETTNQTIFLSEKLPYFGISWLLNPRDHSRVLWATDLWTWDVRTTSHVFVDRFLAQGRSWSFKNPCNMWLSLKSNTCKTCTEIWESQQVLNKFHVSFPKSSVKPQCQCWPKCGTVPGTNSVSQHAVPPTIGWTSWGVPSGKRLHNYGKIHHAINGKIHYFDWAIFNSYVSHYQRVQIGCFKIGMATELIKNLGPNEVGP